MTRILSWVASFAFQGFELGDNDRLLDPFSKSRQLQKKADYFGLVMGHLSVSSPQSLVRFYHELVSYVLFYLLHLIIIIMVVILSLSLEICQNAFL